MPETLTDLIQRVTYHNLENGLPWIERAGWDRFYTMLS